jgi:hypothetical protein
VCVRPQSTCVRMHITARAGCAACDRGTALRATVVRAACMGVFERTKCGRTHFGRNHFFTLSPLYPLLAMI